MFQGRKVGVIVPAYNEEQLIVPTIENVPSYVDRIYAINDGSTDHTHDVIARLSAGNDRVVPIDHTTNGGVGAAIITGYRRCLDEGMDIAMVMGGDNQMDPAQVPSLLTPIVRGEAGYTKGNRMSSIDHLKGMSAWRRLGNWLLRWLSRVSSGNYAIMDPQNGYTAVTTEALRKIDLDSVYTYYGYCNDLLVKFAVAGVRVVEVPMPARYQGEKSKIKYSRYIVKVSWLLLRNYAWRMYTKWVVFGRTEKKDLLAAAIGAGFSWNPWNPGGPDGGNRRGRWK
ncbi:MAG: glycosyltransferase family 2 protein [Chloroflexi bacterium]|nr:glycosyltransferase family 2 protein [Chloroflexota bacterium]